jgi:hypothetical protein
MTMTVGQHYFCQNPGCRCEIEVIKNSTESDSNPSIEKSRGAEASFFGVIQPPNE